MSGMNLAEFKQAVADPEVAAVLMQAFAKVQEEAIQKEKEVKGVSGVLDQVVVQTDRVEGAESDVISVSSGSVDMPDTGPSSRAASTVNFFAEEEKGFHKTYVYTGNVKKYEKFLHSRGVKKFGGKLQELALTTFSSGVMPEAFIEGKRRLRSYVVVGDSLIKYLVSEQLCLENKSAEEMSAVLTSSLTKASLTSVAIRGGYAGFVNFPAGVSVEKSNVAGEHFQALVGVLGVVHGIVAAKAVLVDVGLMRK